MSDEKKSESRKFNDILMKDIDEINKKKKFRRISTILIVFALIVVISFFTWRGIFLKSETSQEKPDDKQDQTSVEVADLSAEAVASWQEYSLEEAGMSFKAPPEVRVIINGEESDVNGTEMDYTLNVKAIALREGDPYIQDRQALEDGEYQTDPDGSWAVNSSAGIVDLDGKNAKKYTTLLRFEVCDYIFSRTLVFYENDYRVLFNFVSNNESLIKESSAEYFKIDKKNCSENDLVWDLENEAPEKFYQQLVTGEGSVPALNWFNSFDKMVETIDFE